MVPILLIYLLSTALKIFWGIKDKNLSMLSDGFDSIKNIITLSLSAIFFRISQQKADVTHHFGHGKFDTFGAVVIGTLQIFLAGIIIAVSILKFGESPLETSLPHSFISFILMTVVVLSIFHLAKKHKSETLKTELWHEASDLIQSFFVIISTFTSIRFFPYANSLFAILVGIILLAGGARPILLIEKFLLDKAPPEEIISVINKISPGKIKIKDVKSLVSGKNRIRIQLTVSIDEKIPLGQAHELGHKIEEEIVEKLKEIGWHVEDFIIHVEPNY